MRTAPWHFTVLVLQPLLVLVFTIWGASSGFAQHGTKGPFDSHALLEGTFIFGVNLAWFDGQYDHDIGPNAQHPSWDVWYDPAKVSGYFNDIRTIGFGVVRIWLMERGEGLLVDHNGIITGLDETFLRNLDDLVRRAGNEKLRLYLCLTTQWNDTEYPSPVVSTSQQKAYLEKAVKPIVQRLKGNPTVFAFDIFNEIESQLRDEANEQKATNAQAQTFIRNNAQAIKAVDPKRLVSAGSGYGNWKNVQSGYYKNLGLDFYDVHVYSDDGFIPHVRELNVDKPVIIGECGQGTAREDDGLQQKAVAAFMRNAIDKGYSGCFLWAYDAKEPFHHLVHEKGQYRPVVADIQRIIRSQSK